MELNKNIKDEKLNKSLSKSIKKLNKSVINNDIRFIQTNYYLNDFNYYTKNNVKMNKLREEKIKEHKKTIDIDKRNNIMPKMLYFNKFFHTKTKLLTKNNLNPKPKPHSINGIKIAKNISRNKNIDEYKKIEFAIKNKSIEQNSKRHIKKTIKAFDDLLQYVDGFKIKKQKRNLNLLLSGNDINDKNNDNSDDEEEINIENYNFDDFKKKFRNEKIMQKSDDICKTQGELNKSDLIKDIQLNEILMGDDNNILNNKENIYITQKNKNEENNKIESQNNNSLEKNTRKKIINKKELTINNMIMISDDSLVDQINKLRKNFKKDLYFNTNNYGKYKFTELGLNYPHLFNKYKKFPDYNGTDKDEKRMFNYKSKIINPRYNYNNIGSFNNKFNRDLSEISNFYGKEQSKGRFLRNPLISMFSKYIPNYEQYKDLKFIENRYTSGNKYKFKLKSLINNKKNNFDRLATNIYNREHRDGYFE